MQTQVLPAEITELTQVTIAPGDFYFGRGNCRISTLLGSCVAVALWHPKRHVGGMCHFLLPSRNGRKETAKLDGRYGEEAVELFMQELRCTKTQPHEYCVRVFGGGDMFPRQTRNATNDIGSRNIEAARQLLAHHGFAIVAEDLGGPIYRSIVLDLESGDIWIRQSKVAPSASS